METAFQISAQLGFYDILVLYGGQGSRSTEEVMCLVEHVVFVQQFTEYLEITRLYGAGEVLYFLEIGIDAPLSGFMRDDGQAYSQFLVFVPVCIRTSFVDGHVSFGSLMGNVELV